MNHIDIIDEHLVIRETVGYEVLNQVPIEDMPKVMEFLKIVYNYNRMKKVVKEDGEPGWSDPMIEMLDREEKESEWQRRKRLEVMKEPKKRRELNLKKLPDAQKIVANNDIVGHDNEGNPMYRYEGIYYTIDKAFKEILEERIERPDHWWWDTSEPK